MVENQPQVEDQVRPSRAVGGGTCDQCAFVFSLLADSDSEESHSCHCFASESLSGNSMLADPLQLEETFHHTAEPFKLRELPDSDYCRRDPAISCDYEVALARELRFGDEESVHEKSEVTILGRDMLGISSQRVTECKKVLTRAFPAYFTAEPSLAEVLENIRDTSNYEVVEVSRLHNRPRYHMWKCFADCYHIRKSRTVYHGTTDTSARCIIENGFRGAASQRSKFGKGIYTATTSWEALAYAEPDHDFLQTLLVCELLQGPTKPGSADQVDFGHDEKGAMILTLTNQEKTILCASQENQLLPTYKITVRFRTDNLHTPSHHNLVRMYHPMIWKAIKAGFALQRLLVEKAALHQKPTGPVSDTPPALAAASTAKPVNKEDVGGSVQKKRARGETAALPGPGRTIKAGHLSKRTRTRP